MAKTGERAADFSAPNQDGKTVRLSQFKGRPVLLYFYPKDDTPGCTKEACSFRDAFADYKKLGAVVLGVSRQDEKSHVAFQKKYNLPFDLLVDRDGSMARAFGVGLMPLIGLHSRKSVLIDGKGTIAKVYDDVDPATHSGEVLRDINGLVQKRAG